MNRLFVRTLLTFFLALLILVGVMAVVLIWAFRRSLSEWDRATEAQIEVLAGKIIARYPDISAVEVPEDPPLFVYDAEGELIFSNREEAGRRRGSSGPSELIPIEEDGIAVGFYHAGKMQFRNDAANNRFFESISRTIWLGLMIALVTSVPFAMIFSRGLTTPAIRVAFGLDRITHGDLSAQVPEKGAAEIVRIARSANRLSKQLRRERSIRHQWVQDIAHDLRTPVSALKAQFEGMRDGVLDVSPARIEKNIREISRIEILVADLEELMRLESPEMTRSDEEIEVKAFIEDLVGPFALAMGEKEVEFKYRIEFDHFRADPVLLHRAVLNFFSNALRHTHRQGTIELSVEPSSGGVLILLANTGDPISEEELEKVFDRLYRGEYARSTPGSGLGLTIARRIAELHGGTVRVRNWANSGVIVEMELPQSVAGINGASEA